METGNMGAADVAVAVARRLDGWAEVLVAVGEYDECDVRAVAALMAEALEGDADRLRGVASSLASD